MGMIRQGGALLIKLPSRLSALDINVDRDWEEKGIANIREIAAGMAVGSMAVHNGSTIVNIPPASAIGHALSVGPGDTLLWRSIEIEDAAALTMPATDITRFTARLQGEVEEDGGAPCEYRFRYQKAGLPGYFYTRWANGKRAGDSFSEDISWLSAGTEYEFSAQLRNRAGDSPWAASLTFETLP